jgi:hypothetical protein
MEGVIREITTWADTAAVVIYTPTPHIYWLHGFAGCGKSAVSLKIADIFEASGRLLASYFFFRNAGDRSTMKRFAVTLASQLASALPATVPYIEAALRADSGLLNASLARQLERLVYKPFQTVMEGKTALPFIIVIDGLDECEDRRGVEEFIDHILDFFAENSSIPLRFFIASRVEQHIRARLEVDGVRLGNIDSHTPRRDIKRFLQASFETAAKRDRVIRAYVRAHGSWPTKQDMNKLCKHIGGSFVLASTMFKYIVQPATGEGPMTPMDRLPLALEMDDLDGLYSQTLARSQHFPNFHNIISTVALLKAPLPIVGIASLLKIEAFEVIGVLLNLQAIIHVPGTDEQGEVTLCHTSLRDFLTTERRSGSLFVPPSFHVCLSYYWFGAIFAETRGLPAVWKHDHHGTGIWNYDRHWRSFLKSDACDFVNDIEQFKSGQPLFVDRLPYHAFLCSTFFITLFRREFGSLGDNSYLLTECTKELALAAECPDHRIRLWLEKELDYVLYGGVISTTQFTEHTYRRIQHDLPRAAAAIHVNVRFSNSFIASYN